MPRRTIRPGIMIAGVPRSGSTILSKVMALSPTVGYVEEPFNSQTGMIGTHDKFFAYIDSNSAWQAQYSAILHDILAGTAHYKENALQPDTKNPLRLIYRHLFTNRYQIRYWLDTHDPRVKNSYSKIRQPLSQLSTFSRIHTSRLFTHCVTPVASSPHINVSAGLALQYMTSCDRSRFLSVCHRKYRP